MTNPIRYFSRLIRSKLPKQANQLDELAREAEHDYKLRHQRIMALQEVTSELDKISLEFQVDDARSREFIEALIGVTEGLKDLATLSMAEHVELYDPETLARALKEAPTDRLKEAFRMIGWTQCDELIALIESIYPKQEG